MRIPDGIIYLSKPLFGRQMLRGKMTVMTTWIDYTFPEKLSPEELELPDGEIFSSQVRVLIPLNNVVAVVAEREEAPIFKLA